MAFALLFRYAERDHEQLSVLCRQKAEMEQKLLTKKVKVEEKSGLDLPLPARAFQIFVDIRRISNKRTIALMVRSTTTVGEVKEMLKTKTGGISVAMQRLHNMQGKWLQSEELMMKDYSIGKEATLTLLPSYSYFPTEGITA